MKVKSVNVAICDDSEADVIRIEKIIKEIDLGCIRMSVSSYTDPEEFIKQGFEELDIVILDIEMCSKEKRGGFKIAAKVRETNHHAKIIFLTNHDEWVQEGYYYDAMRYIYKSASDENIIDVMETALTGLLETEYVLIKDLEYCLHSFHRDEILYIQSYGNITLVKTFLGEYEVRRPLKNWVAILGDSFVQCHRSYLVSLKNMRDIENNELLLRDKAHSHIPVSRKYLPAVKQAHKDMVREFGYIAV